MIAAITFTDILLLLAVITIVHVVLLAPLMVAVIGAWLDHGQNEAIRNQQRLT